MAYTLETITPGTPVFVGDVRVGDVRAVYAEGSARSAELVVVRWDDRGEDVALAANDVATIDERGLTLMNTEPASYATLVVFDPARFPTVRPLT
jgi:hypothetical protein